MLFHLLLPLLYLDSVSNLVFSRQITELLSCFFSRELLQGTAVFMSLSIVPSK